MSSFSDGISFAVRSIFHADPLVVIVCILNVVLPIV